MILLHGALPLPTYTRQLGAAGVVGVYKLNEQRKKRTKKTNERTDNNNKLRESRGFMFNVIRNKLYKILPHVPASAGKRDRPGTFQGCRCKS